MFDAIGTLIKPEPDVVSAYFEAGRRHGPRRSPASIASAFGRVFAETTRVGGLAGACMMDEGIEREFWRKVVRGVFGDLREPAAASCFEELYDHFSRPTAWRTFPDVAPTLTSLGERRLTLAVASDFDARLHGVFGGLTELEGIRRRFVSSEIGWRKPDRRFFAAVCQGLGLAPSEVLYVGDDPDADVAGAIDAGLRGVLVRRNGPAGPGIVADLSRVTALIVPTSGDGRT